LIISLALSQRFRKRKKLGTLLLIALWYKGRRSFQVAVRGGKRKARERQRDITVNHRLLLRSHYNILNVVLFFGYI
jgi:hypothetical protein